MADKLLVDSSFLYALQDQGDKYHKDAAHFAESHTGIWLVPEVTLVEVSQVLYRFAGQHAVLAFLDSLDHPRISLQALTAADIKTARHVMAIYDTAQFDLVDCCIIALSERLNITQICTFDRRDFAMFKPSHTEFLELLP